MQREEIKPGQLYVNNLFPGFTYLGCAEVDEKAGQIRRKDLVLVGQPEDHCNYIGRKVLWIPDNARNENFINSFQICP